MSRRTPQGDLSRRERQIMDALHALGEATAREVVRHIDDDDAYDSVRVTLNILERKGIVRHRRQGAANVYAPVVARSVARRSAMRHLARTFFAGSASQAILAFLDQSGHQLTAEELDEISRRIDERARATDGRSDA